MKTGGYNLKWYKNEAGGPMKVVVIVSAIAEWDGVKVLFPGINLARTPYGEVMNVTFGGREILLLHGGWGKIASAASMQYALDHYSPDLVVNLGTCGGLEGMVERGDLILVERAIVYDIVELMGDPDVATGYASFLDLGWLADPGPHPARRGLIASADGDLLPEKITFLKTRGALAADWESAALAWVAQKNNARLLILRMVSDLVSEHGGEIYGGIEVFNERAGEIMRLLFEQLPDWLDAVRL
jgi:adenosylhomocysteine nucleosidase